MRTRNKKQMKDSNRKRQKILRDANAQATPLLNAGTMNLIRVCDVPASTTEHHMVL